MILLVLSSRRSRNRFQRIHVTMYNFRTELFQKKRARGSLQLTGIRHIYSK